MSRMRWNCNGKGCYLTGRWDSSSIGQHVPLLRGISCTDIDGALEVKNQVLMVENKNNADASNSPQEYVLLAMARLGASVLIQWTDNPELDDVTHVKLILPGGHATGRIPMDAAERDQEVADWAMWADKGGIETHPWTQYNFADSFAAPSANV